MKTPITNIPLIFIIGMHRSGTSALARTLNLNGVQLPKNLLSANQDNPFGYWEPSSVVSFNDRLMLQFDRHWADPKPLPSGWENQELPGCSQKEAAVILRDEIGSVRKQDEAAGIVIKDPRLSRSMPLWRKAASSCGIEPACLIVCRNPQEVFCSLHVRDRFTREHALHLWLAYMLEAEAGTRGMRRTVVSFDALLTDWRATLRVAMGAIGWPVVKELGRNDDMIDSFLNHEHRHHRATCNELSNDTPLDADIKTAYNLFLKPIALEDSKTGFDHLQQRRLERWSLRSPGQGRSGLSQQLPGWHAEQSWVFLAQGRLEDAISAARKAVELAPDIMRFHFILGNLLVKAERLIEASVALKKAINLDNRQSRVYRALALVLEKLGDKNGTIVAIRGAIECGEPVAEDFHLLGKILSEKGCHDEAVAALSQAIFLNKSKAVFHWNLSKALVQAGNSERAIDSARQAVELSPDQVTFARHLGCLLAKVRCPDKTEVAQQFAASRDGSQADLFDRLGQFLAQEDRWIEASEAYKVALHLRSHIFGFRAPAPAKPMPETSSTAAQSKRADLNQMLARLSTQYWADDIVQLVQARQHDTNGEEEWPLGRALPRRRDVSLRSKAGSCAEKPLSVMLPVYEVDREDWLRGALDSVLAQDQGPDWAEIVVMDDASRNPIARKVVESYEPRVRYSRNDENLGLVGNHNKCLSEAKGEFVHILHQDDLIKPNFYQALLPPMQRDDSLVASFSQTGYISEQFISEKVEKFLQPQGVIENWHIKLSGYRIQFPTIIVRRSAYYALGGFSPSLRFAFDWDMWNRIFAFGPVWYEPQPLAQYRIHEKSATSTFGWKERVVDAMQVVAHMLQLLPEHQRRATAELAIYKFVFRYWSMINGGHPGQEMENRKDLTAFLLEGWASPAELEQIQGLLDRHR